MKEVSTLSNKGSDGKVRIKSHILLSSGLIWLVLPVMIFMFGWLRLYIAIPAALILGAVSFLAVKDWKKTTYEVEFDIVFVIAAAVLAVLLCTFCDIGEYVWGTTDHAYRRAILRDLVNYDWPVIYDLSDQTDPLSIAYLGTGKVAFSYYISYWMVPASIGKIAGFKAANAVLLLWSSIGIFLISVCSCFFLKKQTYAVLYTLIFFSGLDFIPYLIYGAIGTQDWMWLEGYTQHIAVISNINNLMNVYNQCIPCWLITVMILMQKNNRNIGLLGSLMFAFSPWATIGVIPLAVWALFRDRQKIVSIFTITNIVPAILLFCIYAPSYMANSNAVSVSGPTFSFYEDIGAFLVGYLMVLAVEVLPFAVLLWKRFHKMSLYWVTLVTLAVLPLYKVSSQNDFTMRSTMPALFVLAVMLAGAINGYIKDNRSRTGRNGTDLIKLLSYVLLILCMSMVAFQMLLVTIVSTFDNTERPTEFIGSFGDINDGYEVDIIDTQFFVHDYEETFFYKNMARR